MNPHHSFCQHLEVEPVACEWKLQSISQFSGVQDLCSVANCIEDDVADSGVVGKLLDAKNLNFALNEMWIGVLDLPPTCRISE